MEIDYSKYSIDELFDIRQNIDKETYPERYAALLVELDLRKPEIDSIAKLKEEAFVSRTFDHIKALAWLQIGGGVAMSLMLLFSGVAELFSIGCGILLIGLAFSSGYFLLKKTSLGYNLSFVNQYLQLAYFSIGPYILNYSFLGGIYLTFTHDFVVGISASFEPGFMFSTMAEQTEGVVGLDLLALFFLFVIHSAYKVEAGSDSAI